MEIVNYLYSIARQHLQVKGFAYGKGYEKGAGTDMYPLVWVDDPIFGASQNSGKVIQHTVNVDFLGLPLNGVHVLSIQSAAQEIGLSFFEKIAKDRPATGISSPGFSFVTLRDYYDDNAAGVRFTFTMITSSPADRCAEYFDPEKQLPGRLSLPDFMTDNPSGCAVFSDSAALPNFRTK